MVEFAPVKLCNLISKRSGNQVRRGKLRLALPCGVREDGTALHGNRPGRQRVPLSDLLQAAHPDEAAQTL